MCRFQRLCTAGSSTRAHATHAAPHEPLRRTAAVSPSHQLGKAGSTGALSALPLGHVVRDRAKTLNPGGIICLGARGGAQHDDAYSVVVASLPDDPPRRLNELRVRPLLV